MLRSLIGAAVGFVLGTVAGWLTAALLLGPVPAEQKRWTSYPTLADATMPQGAAVLATVERGPPEHRYWTFTGLLFGGGFGLVAGAVVGAAGAVVAAVRREPPPPKPTG